MLFSFILYTFILKDMDRGGIFNHVVSSGINIQQHQLKNRLTFFSLQSLDSRGHWQAVARMKS